MIRHSFFDLIREESDTNFKNRFDISSRNFTQYSDRFWLIRSTVWRAWFQPSMNPLEEQSYTNIYTHTYTLSNINPSSSAFRPFFQSDVKTFHAPTAIQIRPRFEETNGARPFVRGRASNITKHRQKKYLEEEEEEERFRVSKGTRLSFFFVFHLLPFWSANWKRIEENSNSFGIFRGLKQKEKRSEKRKETRISKQAVTFTRPFLLITWLFKASSFFFSSPPPILYLPSFPFTFYFLAWFRAFPRVSLMNYLVQGRGEVGRKKKRGVEK